MRALTPWLAALFVLAATAGFSQAYYPNYFPRAPYAPDACGPGFYNVNWCGAQYGPNYWLYPPFPPFNGARPTLQNNSQATPNFPTHPYARSPRDYFMLER